MVVALWMIILLSRKILYHYYTFSAAQLYNRYGKKTMFLWLSLHMAL